MTVKNKFGEKNGKKMCYIFIKRAQGFGRETVRREERKSVLNAQDISYIITAVILL